MAARERLILGVATVGAGRFKATRGTSNNAYGRWYAMIYRCYMPDEKRGPSSRHYSGCTVSESWLNFQNFAEWHEQNYIAGFHIDKDVINPGNTVYSEENCGFLPVSINVCLTHLKRQQRTYDLPPGVSLCSFTGKYQATISLDGVSTSCGRYSTAEAASDAYLSRKRAHLTALANKYRGLIGERMYAALMAYPVGGI